MKTVVTSSYCPKCDMFRSDTTHHCKICDKCVADYDHHCFFVGNCIGANNKHFFIRFLTYTTLLSFMHVVMLIDGLVRHYYMSSYSVNLWFKISIFSIMICVSTLGFAFSAFNLWLQLRYTFYDTCQFNINTKKASDQCQFSWLNLKKVLG